MPFRNFIFLNLIFFSFYNIKAQNDTAFFLSTSIDGQIGNGKYSPFWLNANSFDVYSFKPNQTLIRTSLSKQPNKKIDYEFGIDLIGLYDRNGSIKLQQAYIGCKVYPISIYGGLKQTRYGNQDSLLTSGNITWSGNSAPIPEIYAGIPDYLLVPMTLGLVQIKGGMSHGWLYDNDYYKDAYLHHKYIFFKIGGKWPIHLEYGIHHFAQWGGMSSDTIIGKLPSGLKDFWTIFRAKSGDENSPTGEIINSLGNHIGSRNYGIYINTRFLDLKIFKQDIFEDNSGRRFKNFPDGLYGINIYLKKPNIISAIIYEYLNTTDQSGKYHSYWTLDDKIYYSYISGGTEHVVGGNDNYFNNYIYRTGWTSKNMTIGTPLITSPKYKNDTIPQRIVIYNNKVKAHTIGISGETNKIIFYTLYTFSMNYGTNNKAFNKKIIQNYFLLSLTFKNVLPYNIFVRLDFGLDYGELIDNNVATRITLTRKIGF